MRRLDDERFDLDDRVVFLIGIGGCGMAGLARMLRSRGAAVAGSDKAPTPVTEALAGDGFEVSFDQQAGQLPEDIDLVIASAAIKPDHPELLAAQSRGIATLTYAEALGRAMLGRTAVALAGTHGKSTTTAMLGCAMTDAGLDPTVIVGATCAHLDHGALGTEIEERGRAGHAAGFRLGADAIP
ncbi:MAG: Mur ligase domain-containing protein, partial [Planctomycetota bacterium]